VHVDPIKPKLKPPGNKRLTLEYDGLLSNFAFKSNLRRYSEDIREAISYGRACQLLLTTS